MRVVRHRLCMGLLILAALSLPACGGGGGGGDDENFVGAADVHISANPSSIDTGDRMQVNTDVSNVDDSGIILKFRYPEGLGYVLDSATLEVEGQEFDISPSVNTSNGRLVYLVFFLPREVFGRDDHGSIKFQLEGISAVVDGKIGVDPDVDDPLIDNSAEFNLESPEFEAEDEFGVEVTTQITD